MKWNGKAELILQKSKYLFFRFGLKAISLEDIAKECNISKRTIYEYYDSKQTIVNLIIEGLVQSHKQLFKEIELTSENALDQILKQNAGVSQVCKGIRPSFLSDLEDLYTDAWKILENYKMDIHKGIIENLERGKKEGLYRSNIDIKVISDLRLNFLVNMLNPEFMEGLNAELIQLSDQFTVLYLYSITSEKGKEILDSYFANRSSNSIKN